ncbi:MAG TPA: RDD family protein [Nitrospirota bacterium]|nr:RDD family protein [Nitrospirota bacterium]
MQKADLTTRAVAGFVDLLLVIGLARLPDVLGFLSAAGYLLIRDGLFEGQSTAKKLIGLRVAPLEGEKTMTYRESIIRNVPLALAFMLFLIPYAGWLLGPLALGIECLTAIGDERGMRIGDMLARTWVVSAVLSSSTDEKPDIQTSPPSVVEEQKDTIPRDM